MFTSKSIAHLLCCFRIWNMRTCFNLVLYLISFQLVCHIILRRIMFPVAFFPMIRSFAPLAIDGDPTEIHLKLSFHKVPSLRPSADHRADQPTKKSPSRHPVEVHLSYRPQRNKCYKIENLTTDWIQYFRILPTFFKKKQLLLLLTYGIFFQKTIPISKKNLHHIPAPKSKKSRPSPSVPIIQVDTIDLGEASPSPSGATQGGCRGWRT